VSRLNPREQGWATTDDLRRASNPEEAATALAWQSEQVEIEAQRQAVLELLQGNGPAADELWERWAPLLPESAPGRRQ
jgi:hypothetical protein